MSAKQTIAVTDRWRDRVESGDWHAITDEVNEYGGALLPRLLSDAETEEFQAMYRRDELFRSTVNMGRHRFGEGQYRYFGRPYPEPIERLKQALYPRLLPIARDWWDKLGRPACWPDTLDEWLEMCHAAGQTKSTAILLKYGAKDWNALHRDLYGDLVFPLQVVVNLNDPGVDHTGGEFLLLEQRPRAQSRGTATLLPRGYGYVFTTRDRPVESARGWSAAPVRHGVSAVRTGSTTALPSSFTTPLDQARPECRGRGRAGLHPPRPRPEAVPFRDPWNPRRAPHRQALQPPRLPGRASRHRPRRIREESSLLPGRASRHRPRRIREIILA